MIHALIDTTRVLGKVEEEGIAYEVCAEAIGNHDRGGNVLTVNLRAFLRSVVHEHLGEVVLPEWLPAAKVVTEHVEVAEAHELVDEIFASWCRQVKSAIP